MVAVGDQNDNRQEPSAPPPPPPPKLASSSSSSSPAHWPQVLPSTSFVNGRGNVLPVKGASTPSISPSNSSTSILEGQGKLAYKRSPPQETNSLSDGHESAVLEREGIASFPSAFGVSTRVAVKLPGLQQRDTLRPTPIVIPPIAPPSAMARQASHSPTPSTSALGSILSDFESPLSSPVPPTQPISASIMDRPRPKTPDPFSPSLSVSPDRTPRPIAIPLAPSFPRSHSPEDYRTVSSPSARSPTPSGSRGSSMETRPARSESPGRSFALDRPRTPGSSLFLGRPATTSFASATARSLSPDPHVEHRRAYTPEPSAFARDRAPLLSEAPRPTSVLNRGRPKTPSPNMSGADFEWGASYDRGPSSSVGHESVSRFSHATSSHTREDSHDDLGEMQHARKKSMSALSSLTTPTSSSSHGSADTAPTTQHKSLLSFSTNSSLSPQNSDAALRRSSESTVLSTPSPTRARFASAPSLDFSSTHRNTPSNGNGGLDLGFLSLGGGLDDDFDLALGDFGGFMKKDMVGTRSGERTPTTTGGTESPYEDNDVTSSSFGGQSIPSTPSRNGGPDEQPVQFEPSPIKRRRRRSLASLFSLASSTDATTPTPHPPSTPPQMRKSASGGVLGGWSMSPSNSSSNLSVSSTTPSLPSALPQPVSASLAPHQAPQRRPSNFSLLSFDKSLPPTPATPTPPDGQGNHTLAPAKSMSGKLSRGLSKLKSATTGASSAREGGGFRLVSATTTRKSAASGLNGAAATPIAEVGMSPPPAPRRATLATLFGGGPSGSRSGSNSGGVAASLGMSLPMGRRSADMLTTIQPTTEEEGARRSFEPRRSLDLLTRPAGMRERAPSTDDLLTLATAKLSVTPNSQAGELTRPPTPGSSLPSAPPPPTRVAVPLPLPPPTVLPPIQLPPPSSHLPRVVDDNAHPASHQPQLSLDAPSTATTDTVSAPTSSHSHSASTGQSSPTSSDVSPDLETPEKAVFGTASRVSSPPEAGEEGRRGMRKSVPVLVRGDSIGAGGVLAMAGGIGKGLRKKRERERVRDDGRAELNQDWAELEEELESYTTAVATNRPERGGVISNTLLAFLRKEEDNPSPRAGETLAKRQRGILFRWLATLTTELRDMQPSHRGACLEAVAAIAESHFLSSDVLQDDPTGQAHYRSAIVTILSFAVEKLNDKAVYANTLVFSGRVFALAFFRIEGVAVKLLKALPSVKKSYLIRVLEEAGVHEMRLPPVDLEAFPAHLWSLCLRDFRTYTSLLLPAYPKALTPEDHYLVQDGDTTVEMSGNWLIRWTASDSDLPFAFYRAYHRQLANHLVLLSERRTINSLPQMEPSAVLTAPGALFLAASLLEKSDALVHRNLRAVTSIGPSSSNFNTNDSANLNFGQKPKVLELANRRLVSTMLDIVGGPPPPVGETPELGSEAETRRWTFGKMLRVWIRACVKRTSMWDTRSVFILLDLIEGLIYTLSYPVPSAKASEEEVIVPKPQMACIEMFDIPFIFEFVKIILSTADNTVAIMRTIAFLYAHFEIFTLRSSDRDLLCETIILDETLFSRLYLHWNAGVRGYFIRLLVWRVARLGAVAQEQNPGIPRDPHILGIFSVLNIRLEAIRKRHDELDPLDYDDDDEDNLFKPKRSTICSTRGVKEMPFTVDEIFDRPLDESEDEDGQSQELVRSNGTAAANGAAKKIGLKEAVTVAKVVSWFKGGLGKSKNKRSAITESQVDPFLLNPSYTSPVQEYEDSFDTASTLPPPPPDHSEPDTVTYTDPPRPARARPASGSFYSFEFEGGLGTTAPADAESKETTLAPNQPSFTSPQNGDAAFPLSPNTRRAFDPQQLGASSPRVSLRFSKRISILPPAALDVLRASGQAVPPIPAQYLAAAPAAYAEKLHPYAVRGLRDYEDALDEWTDWESRLQEEVDEGKKHNKGFMDVVPRLAVAWPASFEDGV